MSAKEEISLMPNPIKAYFLAARPKTLLLSLAPIFVGTSLAVFEIRTFYFWLFISALLSAACIQVAVNLFNDALDSKKQVDTDERLGPDRATHKKWLTFDQVFNAACIAVGLAFFFGTPMVIYGGSFFAYLLVASAICSYIYSGGPYPLAHKGLAEVFVIVFFGLAGTIAGFYLQTGYFSWGAFLAGLQIGLMAASVSCINNLRDRVTDIKAHKYTMVVRFGETFGKSMLAFFCLAPFFLNYFWFELGFYKAGVLSIITMPLALFIVKNIWFYAPSKIYNKFLGLAALLTLLFSLSLSIGFWI